MKIGTDAVIITSTKPYSKTVGSWLYVGSETVHRFEGLAIKYKQD